MNLIPTLKKIYGTRYLLEHMQRNLRAYPMQSPLLPLWLYSLRPGASPLKEQTPWITYSAIAKLEQIVKEDMNVFEFGTGGSTTFFLSKKVTLTSVEHSKDWHQEVLDFVPAQSGWTLSHVPPTPSEYIDPTRFDLAGSKGEPNFDFSDYVSTIYENAPYDLVLVDGRARPACAAAAIECCKPDGYIVFDNAEREHYAGAQQHLKQKGFREHRFDGWIPYAQITGSTRIYTKAIQL